jgi:hypothetical protein
MLQPVGTPLPSHCEANTRRDRFVPRSRPRPVDSLVRCGRVGAHIATLFTRFDAVCFESPRKDEAISVTGRGSRRTVSFESTFDLWRLRCQRFHIG